MAIDIEELRQGRALMHKALELLPAHERYKAKHWVESLILESIKLNAQVDIIRDEFGIEPIVEVLHNCSDMDELIETLANINLEDMETEGNA